MKKNITLPINAQKAIRKWVSKMNRYKDKSEKRRLKAAKKWLKLKYKRIGNGAHRVVYDLKNGTVLKVAISKKGLKSNYVEYKVYQHCPDHLRKYFCPVYDVGEGWVIMKKMKRIESRSRYAKLRTKIKKIEKKIKKKGIKGKDINRKNMAYLHRKLTVFIDYGNFKIKKK